MEDPFAGVDWGGELRQGAGSTGGGNIGLEMIPLRVGHGEDRRPTTIRQQFPFSELTTSPARRALLGYIQSKSRRLVPIPLHPADDPFGYSTHSSLIWILVPIAEAPTAPPFPGPKPGGPVYTYYPTPEEPVPGGGDTGSGGETGGGDTGDGAGGATGGGWVGDGDGTGGGTGGGTGDGTGDGEGEPPISAGCMFASDWGDNEWSTASPSDLEYFLENCPEIFGPIESGPAEGGPAVPDELP
jgi:hypothetical protein